jgi:hypothetical protein
MELEWVQYMHEFYEATVLDEILFVNFNRETLRWEFAVGRDVKYVDDHKHIVFTYAQVWANHYYRQNVRFGDPAF